MGILEYMGIALGQMHLHYEEFCRLRFDEFAAIYEAYLSGRDAISKERWNVMRMLATIIVQPHLKKGAHITPEKLLPLPWDSGKEDHSAEPIHMSEEEQRKRMQELVEKFGETL